MTKPDDAAMTGEERLRRRKAAWWRYVGLALIGAMMAGLASGFLTELSIDGVHTGTGCRSPVWGVNVLSAWAGSPATISAGWTSWISARQSLGASLRAYMARLRHGRPGMSMADLELATYPSGGATMTILIGAVLIVYGLRKLGWR